MMNKVTENIFTYDYTFKIMPGVDFPVKSTFIELENHGLMIISPGPFDKKTIQDTLVKYKTVYCVAPNAFHHKHLGEFYNLFPNINIYGPTSLIKKQAWLSDVLMDLGSLKERLEGQVLFFPILGSKLLDETVFYCRRSKSLVVTDLVFNMRDPMPFGRKCLLSLVGARNKIAQSKMIRASLKDKKAYAQAVKPLRELNCERIIVAHGQTIEGASEINRAMAEIRAV